MKRIIISLGLALAVVGSAVSICNAFSTQNSTNVTSEDNDRKVITVNVSHSYAYNVTDINKLYENSELIVTGTVSSIGNAKKDESLPVACTPAQFDIKNTIKGNDDLKNVNILVEGGTITLQEYEDSIKNISLEVVENDKIDLYSADDKNNTFISYVSDEYKQLKNRQDYVLFLNKLKNTNEYVVIGSAGMIPIDSTTSISSIQDIKAISK